MEKINEYSYIIEYLVLQFYGIWVLIYHIKNPPREDEAYDYVLFIRGIFIFIMATVGGIFFLVKKISYIKLLMESW